MTENPLIKKLQLKPGLRALFLNAPEGYVASLGPLPDGVALVDGPPGTLDFVQLFVRDSVELAKYAPAGAGGDQARRRVLDLLPEEEFGSRQRPDPRCRLGADHCRRPAPGDPDRD